jgi:MFS family permease
MSVQTLQMPRQECFSDIPIAVTSLVAGRIGDIFGRRWTLFWGAGMFTLGGLTQTFAQGFPSMVFGRILAGFGVGFLSCVPAPVVPFRLGPPADDHVYGTL